MRASSVWRHALYVQLFSWEMTAVWLLFAGCGDPSSDPDLDGDSDTDTDTNYDCDALPELPLGYTTITNVVSGDEDFAFDDEGNLLGMGGSDLFKSPREGSPTLWIAEADCNSGLRVLPSGDVVCCGFSTFLRFDKDTGEKTVVSTAFDYPNGIEVDLDGFAYLTDQTAGAVYKIDPYTGDSTEIATGLISPNGLTFNRDYTRLYVGAFFGDTIYSIDFDENGTPAAPEVFLTASDAQAEAVGMCGYFNGMGVDACGNLYASDLTARKVFRISEDASKVDVAVDVNDILGWIPSIRWGSGYGGWISRRLYILEAGTGTLEVNLGVPEKERAYP